MDVDGSRAVGSFASIFHLRLGISFHPRRIQQELSCWIFNMQKIKFFLYFFFFFLEIYEGNFYSILSVAVSFSYMRMNNKKMLEAKISFLGNVFFFSFEILHQHHQACCSNDMLYVQFMFRSRRNKILMTIFQH